MAAVTGVSLTTPKVLALESPKKVQSIKFSLLNNPWKRCTEFGRNGMYVRPVAAAPEGLSEKLAESVKNAEESCSENATSGECAAAWDEVEELSAEASHARDKKKESDPLETYCKENPETDECRTYDN
ncbi:calvin cycle protein CP12-2, chloroplastic-like [Olea europaea var. sylvestris]|uniref:calvin cycle protein CP12-2, chloroplastic-like n=1 Tax=Olea europaea var. sylvestris TaxID=158386 RepID=UPI000C1D4A39|nr:calvin cycle protein CP12-2, chloroplastic-like [Olea europaea var. sylvestris]